MSALISLKDAYLEIRDAGSNVILINTGEGTLTYDEKRVLEYIRNRGKIGTANGASVREGDEEPVDVSFQFQWKWITTQSGQVITVEDALKKIGQASDWVSTGDECEPYAVDLVIGHDAGCTGSILDEVITLGEFRYESLNHDVKAGTVSCTGKCNVTMASVARTAYSPPTETT